MDTDVFLIMQMRQGDEEAFDKFVRKHYEDILKYCRFHCPDMEYAQDLTQETFLNFFMRLSEYRYMGKTKNYLYTIAGNLCKNFYKKKKDVPIGNILMEKEGVEEVFPKRGNVLESVLDKMVIEEAVNKLPENLREIVILYYFQGLKLSEIAGVLQIGLPLVKYRLRQAKKQLGQCIGKEEPDGFGGKNIGYHT